MESHTTFHPEPDDLCEALTFGTILKQAFNI